MKILLPLAALAAGFLVAPGAVAQSQNGTPVSRTVAVADLDLATDKDQARLDRRIARAAADVCITDAGSFPQARRDVAQCRAETIAAYAPQRATLIAAARATNGVQLSAR